MAIQCLRLISNSLGGIMMNFLKGLFSDSKGVDLSGGPNALNEASLAYICDNDSVRINEARHNEKYRAFLFEQKSEDEIRERFINKYKMHLRSVYAGEIRVDWKAFEQQVERMGEKASRVDIIDGVYFLLMDAARSIRTFTSSSPGFENIWAEQVFAQIRSVVSDVRKSLKPIVEDEQLDIEADVLNATFENLREKYQAYCTADDSYWVFVIDQIEPVLRKALK